VDDALKPQFDQTIASCGRNFETKVEADRTNIGNRAVLAAGQLEVFQKNDMGIRTGLDAIPEGDGDGMWTGLKYSPATCGKRTQRHPAGLRTEGKPPASMPTPKKPLYGIGS